MGQGLLAGVRSLMRRWGGLAKARRPWLDERGNILILTALALPVLLAMLGLGFETANWYQVRRSMQNAADSAAVAAASNGTSSYAGEAKAVAAQYNFFDGVDGVTITVSNSAPCPGGGSTCYSASITKPVPLVLSQLIGWTGNTTLNGRWAQQLSVGATAVRQKTPRQYCILALAGSGDTQAFRSNGAPFADLNGCNIMSNSSTICNGHNLDAGYGDAHDTSSGCGTTQESGLDVVTDPYLSLAANIPANPCTSYPQEPAKKKDPPLPSSNQFSGTLSWTGTHIICGDMQLTGDVTLSTGSGGAAIVIENGQLDTNGFTIQTASGSAATIIFSGDNGSYTHAPTGGGTLDIAAPSSGPWAGVALYQDPNLTTGVDISAAGNSPTWNITGLVYLPHSSVTFSGAVNKSTNGLSCFGLVVDNITINGTGSIFSESQCDAAGLNLPVGYVPSRGKLVT